MSSTIMLAKRYNPKKLSFPVYVSRKLDGVAAEFKCQEDGKVTVRSRQNKPITSVQHICDALEALLKPGQGVVGELYVHGMSFKDISGMVRQHEPAEDLHLCVYDFFREDYPEQLFAHRYVQLDKQFHEQGVWDVSSPVEIIKHVTIRSQEELDMYMVGFFIAYPDAEGVVIRTSEHLYEPGKRSWGMQKLKQRETVDLKLVSIEEAVDAAGNPKGMAGRFNCEYKQSIIGVGPGKLTYAEREQAWADRNFLVGKIVEVGYMPDSAYAALREPTVIRFRDDKDEPNTED